MRGITLLLVVTFSLPVLRLERWRRPSGGWRGAAGMPRARAGANGHPMRQKHAQKMRKNRKIVHNSQRKTIWKGKIFIYITDVQHIG